MTVPNLVATVFWWLACGTSSNWLEGSEHKSQRNPALLDALLLVMPEPVPAEPVFVVEGVEDVEDVVPTLVFALTPAPEFGLALVPVPGAVYVNGCASVAQHVGANSAKTLRH